MVATLEYETQDDFENQVESLSSLSLEELTLDNWLDSGYRLSIPEKESLFSDDY